MGLRARVPRGSAQLTRGRTGGLWVPCPRPHGVSVAHQQEDRQPVGPRAHVPRAQNMAPLCLHNCPLSG